MGMWHWTGSSYYNGIAHFPNLGVQKIQVGKDLKMGTFFTSLRLTNVSIPFRVT